MVRFMKTTKMRFKNTIFFIINFMLPVTVSAGISGNITLTSDYIWRGVSQTTGDPALQGGVAYSHENGFYAGIWGSNVDFYDESAAGANPAFDNRANYELDLYAGFTGNITESIEWDISLYLYNYPETDRSLLGNSEELFLVIRYQNMSLQLSRDFDNKNSYYGLDVSIPIINELETTVHVGHYNLNGLNNYNDYSFTIKNNSIHLL
jgi:uncharacterized protein (TIGR02001 family)